METVISTMLLPSSRSFSLRNTRCWRELLLEGPHSPELAASLPEFLKEVAQEFLAEVPSELSGGEIADLNRWYRS